MCNTAAAIAAVVVLGVGHAARAEDPSNRSVTAVVGLGTPVGGLGIEGAYRIASHLEVSAGVGIGLSAASHFSPVQWAVMPRYRIGNPRHVLTVGLGLSGGNYGYVVASLCGSQEDIPECNSNDTRYTLWANAEVGGELTGPTGFVFRYFVGYGRILAQGADHCTYFNTPAQLCSGIPGNTLPYANLPYAGVALGHTF